MQDTRGGARRLLSASARGSDGDGYAGFEEAFRVHRTAIYGYVLRMMGNSEDAEDFTVAAFEKALKAWGRRPPDHELAPWLFRIATNCCLDELRRRKRIHWQPWDAFVNLFHPSQVAPDNPEREVLQKEKSELVQVALSRLSERDRSALIMRECYGLSNDEVGKVLGTTRDGAKMTLFRAREKLRSAYLGVGGERPESYAQLSQDRSGGRAAPATVDLPVKDLAE